MKRAFGGTGIVAGYGLTEHPIVTQSAVARPRRDARRLRGARDARHRDPRRAARRRARAAGEDGEIRVRGPHLFRGYVDAALDADAFDADGFFRTGDLGQLDADGFLTVTGRLKDVIIRKGENLSRQGDRGPPLRAPDGARRRRRRPARRRARRAGVRRVVARRPRAPLELADVAAFLRGRGLAALKIPERLELVAELPRNASGKVLKRELQARYDRAPR